MKVLIIEDEYHAAKRLKSLLSELRSDIEIEGPIDSVEDAIIWLKCNKKPDLLFLDIQLADGLSFEILRRVEIDVPIIFTTAFNEYALKAFKSNSIDYLLKPVSKDELAFAFNKYLKLYTSNGKSQINADILDDIIKKLTTPDYINRFLIKNSTGLTFIPINEIAYFYSDNGITRLMTHDKKRHHIDYTLEQLEGRLDPQSFHRINRSMIVSLQAIQKAEEYFNNRYKLKLKPSMEDNPVVSRDRVKTFKDWLGQ
jgi:DNA-binding LytR/AlgR family response regulator